MASAAREQIAALRKELDGSSADVSKCAEMVVNLKVSYEALSRGSASSSSGSAEFDVHVLTLAVAFSRLWLLLSVPFVLDIDSIDNTSWPRTRSSIIQRSPSVSRAQPVIVRKL